MLSAPTDVALQSVWEATHSLGKTVSSESFIFRFPLSAYPVLELALPRQGQWGVSYQAGRPGTPFSRPSLCGGGWRHTLILVKQFIQFT